MSALIWSVLRFRSGSLDVIYLPQLNQVVLLLKPNQVATSASFRKNVTLPSMVDHAVVIPG